MCRRAAGLLLLALAGLASAQERFYPVVGPDGRVRMIRGEAAAPGQDKAETKDGAGEAAAAPGKAADGAARPAVPAPAAAGAAEQEPRDAVAPYGSESYTDVEDIEGTAEEAGTPDRFYLIRDGSGQYITESRGDGEQAARKPAVVAPTPEQRFSPLPSQLLVDDDVSDAERPEGVPACLPAAELAAAPTAGVGTPVTVVVNRNSYAFMGPGKVAAIVRLGESGMRTLVSRSYSAKDRKPAFLDPELLFLDARGCARRRVSGLFERRYDPTPRRHPMLRGELLVHADEEYVLVVAATGSRRPAADRPFTVSSHGQLSFSLKK